LVVDSSDGRFLGFCMPSVKGVPLHLVIKDWSWTILERVEIARQLARLVTSLHGRNVYVGDLSPNNVLVLRDGQGIKVVLIDADSLSLPGFPGAVATSRYLLPSVHRREEAFVAGPAGDAHAMSFLAFELLLGGLSPYAHKGGEDCEEDNIKKQFFAMAEDPARVPCVPVPWLARWQQLPPDVKRSFESAFRRGSAARPCAGSWVRLFASISFPQCWADVAQPNPVGLSKPAMFDWRAKRKSA
jgi:DNA-binding helix-hairpin-helix protein with protein kinase domain